MEKYKNRGEVPEKYKWDLSDFFENEDDFENNFKKCQKDIELLKKYVGCTKDAKKLYEYLELEINTVSLWEDLYVYAYLINDQELGISKNLERKNRTEILNAELNLNTSFFAPELLNLKKEEYGKLFKDNNKLLDYKIMLDAIYREKEHVLNENEEKIISELVNSMNHFEDISSTLLNGEHYYGKIKLDDGSYEEIATNNYRKLMRNKNVKIRKKVYNSFNKVIDQYSTTSASLLNSYVSMNNSVAKIRKYNSSWDEKLFGMNMNDHVYNALVSTVENNLKYLHKYYLIKRKSLGLSKLHMYDLYLEMSKDEGDYSIEEAQSLIRESLKYLGEDYIEKYDKVINNRYIDYCQYKGKCSGGYSFSTLTKDSRILMSYNNNIDSISTIAHEAGHNIHHQYVSLNNALQYRTPVPVVTEVASLTNECLLSNYLLNYSNDLNEKKVGLENIISVIESNLFGAVREGKIEQDMYEHILAGGVITKDYMDTITLESLKKYYGSKVILDNNAKNSWVTRSHYYMNFYLYSYAISICVAINVADKIINGDKMMLDNYKKFLSLGSDVWPIDAFKVLGINLEDKQVYEDAIKYFDHLIDEYNKLLEVEEKSNE